MSHPVHLSSTSGLTIEPKVLICRILSSVFTEPGRRSELQAEETQIGNFPVAIAWGPHLFPFRTQKLSPTAPMVLPWRRGGRVGRCRRTLKAHRFENIERWAFLPSRPTIITITARTTDSVLPTSQTSHMRYGTEGTAGVTEYTNRLVRLCQDDKWQVSLVLYTVSCN